MEGTAALAALRSLAHDVRLDVFRRLVPAGPEGIAAGALAEALGVPAPTLSFHLSQLLAGGLVTSRREGRSVLYALEPGRMRSFLAYLTEDCCQGRPELCAPIRACGTERSRGRTAGGRSRGR